MDSVSSNSSPPNASSNSLSTDTSTSTTTVSQNKSMSSSNAPALRPQQGKTPIILILKISEDGTITCDAPHNSATHDRHVSTDD